MYLKTVTVRKKIKGRRAKKVYRYVRVVARRFDGHTFMSKEYVVATLGTLSDVRAGRYTLIRGLENLPRV